MLMLMPVLACPAESKTLATPGRGAKLIIIFWIHVLLQIEPFRAIFKKKYKIVCASYLRPQISQEDKEYCYVFFSAIQYGCFAFCEQVDVKMDPPVFIMKSMNNEKMGQIQGESRLLDIKMIVNRTESV